VRPLRPGALLVRATRGELSAPPGRLTVLPAIGLPLSGPPSSSISAGGGPSRVRANALVDCSGSGGCETPPGGLRPRGCVRSRPGADIRIRLLRRPARWVDVLLTGPGGSAVDGGRALAQGRSALGWRFPVRGRVTAAVTMTLVVVYPDRTGAITVVRLRPGGC